MSAVASFAAADARVNMRSRVTAVIAVVGAIWAVLVVMMASGPDAAARSDALQTGAASLLLLGGLAAAVVLGGAAFPGDAHRGYLGLVVAAGASPGQVAFARVAVRLATLTACMLLWGAVLQAGSLARGLGFDDALAVHTGAMILNACLVLAAAAAMSSLIGAIAAGTFGMMVFVSAQAAVNLKAALDQHAVSPGSSVVVTPMYMLFPRAIVSPMMEDHQRRGITSLAAPALEVNGLDVIVPSSGGLTVAWTLLWTVLLVLAATVGLGRRQL